MQRSLSYDIAFFIALLATAIALGGALAHLFELPNKIGLTGSDYFVVQKAYRGWNRLAIVLLVELVSMIAVAVMSRGWPPAFWPAVLAILFLICAQAIFWIYTVAAHVATENWTVMPTNWRALRAQWEYSHAAGAGFQLLAMCSLIVAVLRREV
jgi:hypothetical protein